MPTADLSVHADYDSIKRAQYRHIFSPRIYDTRKNNNGQSLESVQDLNDLFHAVHALEQGVDGAPETVGGPEADAAEAVFPYQSEPRADASRVLEPHHMAAVRCVGVVEVRRLGGFVIPDLRPAGGGELLGRRI